MKRIIFLITAFTLASLIFIAKKPITYNKISKKIKGPDLLAENLDMKPFIRNLQVNYYGAKTKVTFDIKNNSKISIPSKISYRVVLKNQHGRLVYLRHTGTIKGIKGHQTKKVEFVKRTKHIRSGANRLKLTVKIDPRNKIPETNEKNNTFEKTVIVSGSSLDLRGQIGARLPRYASHTSYRFSVMGGRPVRVKLYGKVWPVSSRGDAFVPRNVPLTCRVLVNDSEVRRWTLTNGLRNHPSEGKFDFFYDFPPQNGTYNLKVEMDIDNNVPEEDESNNVASSRQPYVVVD